MGQQLKLLEEVRRDFVANVSHELKTPITSIKGFVETLQEGAAENREDRDRFLEIIAKQSQRMTAIIEDLLVLARLEGERGGELLLMQDTKVEDVLNSVRDLCKARAEQKNIEISVSCQNRQKITVDPSLIEQALVNLVDNAIKYSGPNSLIRVIAENVANQVAIRVIDQGPGIPADHLPRLFERFYRVDKARSRKLGGTGLGLAIVKHIASVHKGRVEVESEVGRGSMFTIFLPRAA